MAAGLPVSDVVNVNVSISPVAAPTRNFGAGLIVGPSAVIDTNERIRVYPNLTGVSADFPILSPEYLAAARHFAQVPQPSLVYIGRFAQTDTSASLHGGVLSPTQQLITNFRAITNGTMQISVDGVAKTLTGMDFSQATNLNGVAATVDTALSGATVVWNASVSRFEVTSNSTGTTSTLGWASAVAPASGTDLSALFKLTQPLASAPVNGIGAELLVSAIRALTNKSGDWYAAVLAIPSIDAASVIAAAQYIEGLGKKRIMGKTITETTVIDPTITTDLGSLLKTANFRRTWSQYSSDPNAIASFFGRASTTNFNGSNTTQTLKFKVEPGVTAETITEDQNGALRTKNVNVFVNYDNGTAIIQQGVMADGSFFDEVQGLDWLENDVQTAIYNLLRTVGKIPQTDAGMHTIKACIEARLEQAVTNSLLAPGIWNAAGFGGSDPDSYAIKTGQLLDKGYLVYCAPVATQSQADREARHAVPMQVALKLAGAVHDVDVLMNVNR